MSQQIQQPSTRSGLRNESTNDSLPDYFSIEPQAKEPSLHIDSAMYSADEEEGPSPEFASDYPSSPPVLAQDDEYIVPSSPLPLPRNPTPADSGFLSDTTVTAEPPKKAGRASAAVRAGKAKANKAKAWNIETPGDASLLPRESMRPDGNTKVRALSTQVIHGVFGADAPYQPRRDRTEELMERKQRAMTNQKQAPSSANSPLLGPTEVHVNGHFTSDTFSAMGP
ncbi:hypothetical protein LTS18_001526, partial [Coniosporium uncinatum]